MDYLSLQRQRQLVASTESGDRNAFGVLYEQFRHALTGYVGGRLSTSEDVEDVVGDCFLLALKAVQQGRFDPQYSFYTFLRGIADNQVKRFLKRAYVQSPRRSLERRVRYVPRVLAMRDESSFPTGAWQRTDQMLASLPARDSEAVASELLRLVLSSPSKPHQNLALCLVRFLEWRPHEVVRELTGCALRRIAERVYESFAALFPGAEFGEDSRGSHCPEFWRLLEQSVVGVYPEPEYERLRTAGPARTGDVLLEAFYGPSPTASLSDWCDKARRRARKAALSDMCNGEQ
jgi:DNA-directed RNA polymerase specialized sigma24 family protein